MRKKTDFLSSAIEPYVCKTETGFDGYWATSQDTNRSSFNLAQWIWLAKEDKHDMCFARKVFELSAKPIRAELKITASSRYELYINEQYVSSGPARCAPHHQSYDCLDISSALEVGKNVIAVKVHHQKEGLSYHMKSRGGLLAELDLDEGRIQTDDTWKVKADRSWSLSSPRSSRFNHDLLDRVDLTQYTNWKQVDCDEIDWTPARVLVREEGWPSPQENERPGYRIAPWTNFILRDIPYLKESYFMSSAAVMETVLDLTPIDDEHWDKSESQLKISDIPQESKIGKFQVLKTERAGQVYVFDFAKFYNGRPTIRLKAPKGTIVDIISSPFLQDGELWSRNVDADLVDRIRCSGDEDHWTSFYIKPVRWIAVVFRHLEGEATLMEVGVHTSEYPFKTESDLSLPGDEDLQQFWKASQETIKSCTVDAYTDNYRERRQYAQTAFYACLGNYATFGDSYLQRRYLLQIAQEQTADGLMPAYAPMYDSSFMVILDSNCFWLKGLRQYYLQTGDEETVSSLIPSALKLVELLNSYCNTSGLIDKPPFPYWLDHARNDRRGANFCLNGHYLEGLEGIIETLENLDETAADLRKLRMQASQMRESLKKYFWNDDKGLYVDSYDGGEATNEFSEHANAMALSLKIGDHSRLQRVCDNILNVEQGEFVQNEKTGAYVVTPAMSYYLHKGLCDNGRVEESISLFKDRFLHMLEQGENRTLWEEWWQRGTGRSGRYTELQHGRSDAQTESAFPAALILQYVFGLSIVGPGFKKIELRYNQIAGLNKRKIKIPTPFGPLEIDWNLSNDRLLLELSCPEEIKINYCLESFNSFDSYTVRLNGEAEDLNRFER